MITVGIFYPNGEEGAEAMSVHADHSPFHQGERELQERAGVSAAAERVGAGINQRFTTAAQVHLMTARTAMLAASDVDGACWVTVALESPGFLEPTRNGLRIHRVPNAGDPTGPRKAGDHLGLLVIDLNARRRLRVNGLIQRWGPDAIDMTIQEAYGNCPRYIHRRSVDGAPSPGTGKRTRSRVLSEAQREWVRQADTFYIGTHHPSFGADASHRAGPAGFVETASQEHLVIPDYAGNNMFNTLGNIVVNPAVGLLFWDLPTGRTLQITGHAVVDHDPPAVSGVARQLRVSITGVVEAT